jgi:hypothetical protein
MPYIRIPHCANDETVRVVETAFRHCSFVAPAIAVQIVKHIQNQKSRACLGDKETRRPYNCCCCCSSIRKCQDWLLLARHRVPRRHKGPRQYWTESLACFRSTNLDLFHLQPNRLLLDYTEHHRHESRVSMPGLDTRQRSIEDRRHRVGEMCVESI